MNRYIAIALVMLLGSVSSYAQEYEVLKDRNEVFYFSDENGNWLTRKEWQDRFGRKAFRKHFGNGLRHDHSQEADFYRDNIQQSIKLVGEGNIVWERVVECDAPREELMLAARKRVASIVYESDDKIVGGILEHGFIRDELGRPWGIKHAHWKGIVTYEFKEGRYKVSVSNIQYKASRGGSLGIYAISLSTEKAYAPIANLLYPYSDQASDYRYFRLVDFLDYNFTTNFVLFEANTQDSEW